MGGTVLTGHLGSQAQERSTTPSLLASVSSSVKYRKSLGPLPFPTGESCVTLDPRPPLDFHPSQQSPECPPDQLLPEDHLLREASCDPWGWGGRVLHLPNAISPHEMSPRTCLEWRWRSLAESQQAKKPAEPPPTLRPLLASPGQHWLGQVTF